MKAILHEVQQRSDDWRKLRLGKVTASRAADVMAFGVGGKELMARKNYRESLVGERLTGLPADPDQYVSYDMKWGIASEATARTIYQMTKKCIVEDAPFFEHPDLKCGVSPDGLVVDTATGELGLLEIKCPRSANHLFKAVLTQSVPKDYIPQIQMQLWLTDRAWCDFVSYDSRLPQGLQLFIQRVQRDDDYIAQLEMQIKRFLKEIDDALIELEKIRQKKTA
jgi:putative phage-type endonuclease